MFLQNLGLFFSSFLGTHLKTVEFAAPSKTYLFYSILDVDGLMDRLRGAHEYMIRISQIKEREVFKVCIEYWTKMVSELFEEMQSFQPVADQSVLMSSGMDTNTGGGQRKDKYTAILSRLRLVMIQQMVKPEEVLIVENDEGEIVREFIKETDTVVLYKQMKEILVYLTHLDVEDTETIMIGKLSKQVFCLSFFMILDGRETWQRMVME
jgi:exportin-1